MAGRCGNRAPFLLSGTYAVAAYTGISRPTKDLDVFCKAGDFPKVLAYFQAHGYRTDVFDAVPLASCRMYGNAREVWQGLAKNATEGLAAPPTLLPVTLVWTLGQLLPPGLVVAGAAGLLPPAATGMAAAALALSYLPRLAMTRRYRQPWLGAALHPLGVLLLLAIQWYALVRSWTGRRPTWKGRAVVPGRAA